MIILKSSEVKAKTRMCPCNERVSVYGHLLWKWRALIAHNYIYLLADAHELALNYCCSLHSDIYHHIFNNNLTTWIHWSSLVRSYFHIAVGEQVKSNYILPCNTLALCLWVNFSIYHWEGTEFDSNNTSIWFQVSEKCTWDWRENYNFYLLVIVLTS